MRIGMPRPLTEVVCQLFNAAIFEALKPQTDTFSGVYLINERTCHSKRFVIGNVTEGVARERDTRPEHHDQRNL